MTIAATTNRVTYTGNGVSTAFAFAYPFHAQADLVVIETIIATGVQTTKALTTDYTISGTTDAQGHYTNGGTVTAVTAPASTVTWTIYRDPSPIQSTDFVQNDDLPAESLESALDYQTLLNQRTRDMIARALRQPEGDSATIDYLPAKVTRASKYLAFDADGDPVATAGTTSSYVVSTFMETLLDDADENAAKATLAIPSTGGHPNGFALVTDPFGTGGASYNHRSQPNPIINGNMEIWQRGASFAAAADGQYAADRFKWKTVGAGVVTLNRSVSVPDIAYSIVLLIYSLEVDVTTADASLAAGDTYSVRHIIEGYNWRHFAQRQIRVSFWVLSSKTGVHSFAIRNSGTDRYYIAEYTITSAGAWERKTITISASPSGGTWDYSNGIGAELIWTLAAGSNFVGTVDAWTAGALYASTNQVNVMDDTANYFRITGVKLELGSVDTPIQFVPYEEQLARCQRYYQKSFRPDITPGQNRGLGTGEYRFAGAIAGAGTLQATVPLITPMRSYAPTVTLYNPSAANAEVRNVTDGADASTSSAVVQGDKNFILQATGNAGATAGDIFAVHWAADAEL